MPVGKKVGVVITVLASGAGLALFFRKDASQNVYWLEAPEEQRVFRDRVERRVASDAAWANQNRVLISQAPAPTAQRVPAVASIPERSSAPVEPGVFHKSFSPVGALLQPIDGIPVGEDEPEAFGAEQEESNLRRHVVVDGDTLVKLAVRYLGRGDRYQEIFDLNRDILTNPDLLPIGTALKIPARNGLAPVGRAGAAPLRLGNESEDAD